ncbi:hypothetical protein BN12_610015 [Nostocoides japonicum T1-X7]|uniref:Uncharacterized protein n=1 Tax=Nostocoides japonicum T1-X7 TaxID=1194083 RepID=A0A077M0N6_9MICO|nr:hypothetical protein [Tetrasphaera japonica]CCH79873.1 hypothetical protein BN12_610015 [Tetrasphaera japonica T1-X7]
MRHGRFDARRLRTIVLEVHEEERGARSPRPVDPEFILFLHDRLCEEVVAATRRRETATPDQVEGAERGLRLLDELVGDIRAGRLIDSMSRRLLALAYGDHRDFRPEWGDDAPRVAG